MRLVVLSAEPWDEVWRRNQHLATQLLRQGFVDELTFIEPALPQGGRTFSPEPGIVVVRPRLLVPKRLGGLLVLAAQLRAGRLRRADQLWVNDAPLGAWCVSRRQPAFYDVTDDWRTADLGTRIHRRQVRAENRLARRARTIVCSQALADRWSQRYGVDAPVVPNGIDADAFAAAEPVELPGAGPHVGYVGTLHAERLDLDLVLALARAREIGTVHLVGPDCLTESEHSQLRSEPSVRIHGPVPAAAVPGWLGAMDVLVCPHLVTAFTLSLDAIKSREYLATGRPIVATPTSGFQLLGAGIVADRDQFVEAVTDALSLPAPGSAAPNVAHSVSWAERASEFATAAAITA